MKFSTMANTSLVMPGNSAQSDPTWKFLEGFFFQTEPSEIKYLEEDRITENITFKEGEPYLSQKACALKRTVLNSSNGVDQYEYTIQFWKARHYPYVNMQSHADVNIECYSLRCDNTPWDNDYRNLNDLWPKSADNIEARPLGGYYLDSVKRHLRWRTDPDTMDCYKKDITHLGTYESFHRRGQWPELTEDEQNKWRFWIEANVKPCDLDRVHLSFAKDDQTGPVIENDSDGDSGDATSGFGLVPSKQNESDDIVTKDQEMRDMTRRQSHSSANFRAMPKDRTRNDDSADSGYSFSDDEMFSEPLSDKTSQPELADNHSVKRDTRSKPKSGQASKFVAPAY